MATLKTTGNKENSLSKKKLVAISFFLVLGSAGWSVLGFSIGLAYGFTGKKLDLMFWLLAGPAHISSFLTTIIWNPLLESLGPLKYELDFLVPFLGIPGLLIISALIALFINKFFGKRPAFLFSIIFGLLPIIAFTLIFLSSSIISSKRQSELQAQQQKQIAEIKSRLPIKEPTYIPGYLIKTREVPKDDGITFEYQWREILSEYPTCFTITHKL